LERERAEQERVEREKITQKWAEQEKLGGQKDDKEKPAKKQTESKAEKAAIASPQVKKVPEKKLILKEQDQTSHNFRWYPVLLIALGWAVGVSFGVSLLGLFSNIVGLQPPSYQLLGSVARVWVGALGGLFTALTLWQANLISRKKSIWVITLGWVVGWVVAWTTSYTTIFTVSGSRVGNPIGVAVGGAIGGLAIAYSLWKEKVISNWKTILIVALGWSFGWAMAESLYLISDGALRIEFIGLLIGAIGGTVLLWQTGSRPDPVVGLRRPIWGPVLGITLGWAFGLPNGLGYRLPVGTLFGMTATEALFSNFGWVIGLVVTGAIAGGITGVSLWRVKVVSHWKTVLWIALGWMLALPIGRWLSISMQGLMNQPLAFSNMIYGLIQGALGGFVMTFILRTEGIRLGRHRILAIMMAWGIGMAVYWTVPQFVLVPVDNSDLRFGLGSLSAALTILFGAFTGVVGGYILIRQIRAEKTE
jgi:hypothetical protein